MAPTIYDVAKKAGVSTYTVSSVLNATAYVSPELTKRVRDAVRELDYTINHLARSLQTRKTRTLGMLIPDIANPFYAKVVRGTEDVLKELDYSLILGNTYNDNAEQSRYLGLFRSKQVDGLLLFIAPGDESEVRSIAKGKTPVVFVGRTPMDMLGDSVSADNKKGTRMAVQHLLSRGHKGVALVNGQEGLSSSVERVSGWKRALKAAGLASPQQWLIHGNWTVEAGYEAGIQLLSSRERPTAVFTANLLMMTGVLKAIKDKKLRCPEDLEVMTSDDSDWLDVFKPSISTIAQPSYEMGAEAARLALKRIRYPSRKSENIVLEPKLVVR